MRIPRCHCGPLIKAIDAYIRKADENLADALEEEGYVEPEKTVRRMNRLEDAVTDALEEETRHFKSAAENSIDLEAFAALVWPSVKLSDPLKNALTAVFLEQFSIFMPQFIGYYLKRTDKNLKLEQISRRTVAWVESWSGELSGIMQLNSHAEVEEILTTGLKDGFGIEEFTRRMLESGIRNGSTRARTGTTRDKTMWTWTESASRWRSRLSLPGLTDISTIPCIRVIPFFPLANPLTAIASVSLSLTRTFLA